MTDPYFDAKLLADAWSGLTDEAKASWVRMTGDANIVRAMNQFASEILHRADRTDT